MSNWKIVRTRLTKGAISLILQTEIIVRLPDVFTDASQMSLRERQVGEMLLLQNKEIASRLNISLRTVKWHVSILLRKTQCRTRQQARAVLMALMIDKK